MLTEITFSCYNQINPKNPSNSFKIKDRELVTQFSNNIRSDFSYMNRTDGLNRGDEVMFRQNGRSVFKEVCPMVVDIISNQLSKLKFTSDDIKRFWLHQANGNMINFVAKKLKGTHDFSTFREYNFNAKFPIKTIYKIFVVFDYNFIILYFV